MEENEIVKFAGLSFRYYCDRYILEKDGRNIFIAYGRDALNQELYSICEYIQDVEIYLGHEHFLNDAFRFVWGLITSKNLGV
jgi:hypothetical protein